MSKQNTSSKGFAPWRWLKRMFFGASKEYTLADERYDSPGKLAVKRFFRNPLAVIALTILVGMFQGGIQALSRSHFAKIIPPEKSGEYFGLFDICGKGASFLGTMIVSVGSQLTGSANVGVGSLIVLFVVGFVLFRVSDQK